MENVTKMLNCRQLAELLGCSQRSIWRWAKDGTLPPAVRVGAARRWSERSIRGWVETREREALAEQKARADG